MKRSYPVVALVLIMAVISFSCDNGSDDTATTALGQNPSLSVDSLTQLDVTDGSTSTWTNSSNLVIVAVDELGSGSDAYVGIDDNGDAALSMTLSTPSTLYDVGSAFVGASISDTTAKVFVTGLEGFGSLADYQNGLDPAARLDVFELPAGWSGADSGATIPSWGLIYSDTAVTITGSFTSDGVTIPVNLALQPGWNLFYDPFPDNDGPPTEISSKAYTAGAKWFAME